MEATDKYGFRCAYVIIHTYTLYNIYIHTFIYIYTYTHTYIYIHVCIYIHTYIYTYCMRVSILSSTMMPGAAPEAPGQLGLDSFPR